MDDMISWLSDETLVSKYKRNRSIDTSYQTEAQLEDHMIEILVNELSYERVDINSNEGMKQNLRKQLEKLNGIKFTDSDWFDFYKDNIKGIMGVKNKTKSVQKEFIKNYRAYNGNIVNVKFFDKENLHRNTIQVLNQYTSNGENNRRYDVTVLVNGFPLVHIELKKRGVNIENAYNQIEGYKRDSFFAEDGLYEFVQLYVISNGTETKYYSNTTSNTTSGIKDRHTKNVKNKSSFEFTSYWSDKENNNINDLDDFTRTFFEKRVLLNILFKYCVFTSTEELLVLRPYQIAAVEAINKQVNYSIENNKYCDKSTNGYIWHSTGSGKTLTSFKAAQLISERKDVDKVIFVVDRKDLDYQTKVEFDKYSKDSVNGTADTKELWKTLLDVDAKIVVTTIQKLSNLLSKTEKYSDNGVFEKHIVFVFDECHRGQFGVMHKKIVDKFKKYNLFGFTGTPIFADNASTKYTNIEGSNLSFGGLKETTESIFGEKLHSYTILDAIHDNNILPFKVDFVDTMSIGDVEDKQVRGIDEASAKMAEGRVRNIVEYILENFDNKTYRNRRNHNQGGFNSIFAVSKVEDAITYYKEFEKQQKDKSDKLKIAMVYTPKVDVVESEETLGSIYNLDGLEQSKKDYLEEAIKNYNLLYKTSYDANSNFIGYIEDISRKMKSREIDILIVVRMFLTGFDVPICNTLWVDKPLESHNLIQAFSRTNRIYDNSKRFGNIVCFLGLTKQIDDAVELYCDKNSSGVVLLKSYNEYMNGYMSNEKEIVGYRDLANKLNTTFSDLNSIVGEKAEIDFIDTMGALYRLRNVLTSFDEFKGNRLLTDRKLQDCQSIYIKLYGKYSNSNERVAIDKDIVFEMELVKQIEVDVDYILNLLQKSLDSGKSDLEYDMVHPSICSSTTLRSKDALIHRFIEKMNVNIEKNIGNKPLLLKNIDTSRIPEGSPWKGRFVSMSNRYSTNLNKEISDLSTEWGVFVEESKQKDLDAIITELDLDREKTILFINKSLSNGYINEKGEELPSLLPTLSRSTGALNRRKIETIERFKEFIDKYNIND